jgi:MFS family permease
VSALLRSVYSHVGSVLRFATGYIMTEMGDRITREDKEFLAAAVFMGMLLGGMVAGYISDAFGRKKALLISLGINFLAGVYYRSLVRLS